MITLHPRLSSDCHHVGRLEVCQLLLMDDATYPWLILVPDRDGLRDLHDLVAEDHLAVMRDITKASKALQALIPADKINVAALGNQVPQLHIHVVARQTTDRAWPGPIWGAGPAKPYDPEALQQRLEDVQRLIGLSPLD